MTHVLPKEWIASWDPHALAAGAIAVKTYAWFRTMVGNAYSSGSNCADITDYTSDQVFDPTVSFASTDEAVYATLGSALWRDRAVFLSQYWSGASTDPCAPVTGQFAGRMSQWGTQTCATKQNMIWYDIVPVFYANTTFNYVNNLLENPTAEDPAMYMWTHGSSTTITRVQGGAYGGSYYWTIKTSGSGNATFDQKQLEDGTTTTPYHLKIALMCPSSYSSACAVSVKIIESRTDGTWKSVTDSISVPRDGAWRLYHFDPKPLSFTHAYAEVKILSKRTVGIDNVTLTSPYGT
jgi:hypothetical protein